MADPAATLLASWLTPSSLFIVLNLVIGTIAITCRFTSSSPKPHDDPADPPQLHRSPSLLERVRSFKLSHYYDNTNYDSEPVAHSESSESTQPQLVRSPSLLERLKSFNLAIHKYEATESETHHLQPEPEDPGPNLEKPKLVRSSSLLQRFRSMSFSGVYRSESIHGEEEQDLNPGKEEEEGTVERRRPATTKETTTSFGGDEEVDAKADDFINRFKKQLRLQRVDSILRYRRANS